jgi:hypothetical protein
LKAIWGFIKTVAVKAATRIKAIFSVVDWKDVGVRVVKTFVETAGAFIIAAIKTALETGTLFTGGIDADTLFVTAVSAAIAAVWNGVLSPVAAALKQKADEEFEKDE